MAEITPVNIKEFIELENVGINPAKIKLDSLTFEYDKSIYVREKVIDISDLENPIRRIFSVEKAIINPSGEFLIMKEEAKLTTFDIGLNAYGADCKFDESVIFWTWIDVYTIAIITDTKVYHWSKDTKEPRWIIDRIPALAGFCITDYKAFKWSLLLGGIPTEVGDQKEGGVDKKFQTYSMELLSGNSFDARAATLGQVTMSFNRSRSPTKVICVVRGKASYYKLCLEPFSFQEKDQVYVSKSVQIVLQRGKTDYPVDIKVIQKYDIVCVITFHCSVNLFDMESATCIYRTSISIDTIFLTTPKYDETGFLAVTENGQVYSIEVEESTLIPYIKDTIALPDLALRIAMRKNLPGADNLVQAELDRLLLACALMKDFKSYAEAVEFVAWSPKAILRTVQTIDNFMEFEEFPICGYFSELLKHVRLNEEETLDYYYLMSNNSNIDSFERSAREDKIECNRKVGDLIRDDALALRVFLRTHIPNELVDFLLARVAHFSTRYPRKFLGDRCERDELLEFSLEEMRNWNDIKIILEHAHLFRHSYLEDYFQKVPTDKKLELMESMLKRNIDRNYNNCISFAMKYREELPTNDLISLFEHYKCNQGLFHILQSALTTCDEDVTTQLKYIGIACKLGNIDEAKKICRHSNFDASAAQELFETQWLLLTWCSKFDYAHDLVFYLLRNGLEQYIARYLEVNPHTLPAVVEGFLDYCKNKPESYPKHHESIKKLIMGVKEWFSTDKLVEVLKKRNEHGLLKDWLETRVEEGCLEQAINDALAKLYIDSNTNPEKFLSENKCYDIKAIGEFCRKQGKHELACMAYERGFELLDTIGVCNQNSFLEIEARNLVRLKCSRGWDKVLSKNDVNSRHVVSLVVNSNMFGTMNEDEIRTTLLALQENDLSTEYMELLRKVVFAHPEISDNNDYQTKLIMTAIDIKDSKVKDYVESLDNYMVSKVLGVAFNAELDDVVLRIIDKFKLSACAISDILKMPSSNTRVYAWKFLTSYGNAVFRKGYDFARPHKDLKYFEHKYVENIDEHLKALLKTLSEERIFHRNSDYLDLEVVLNKGRHVLSGSLDWQVFYQERKDLKSLPYSNMEYAHSTIAIAFNDDLSHILLVKGTNNIFTFPEKESLCNFGLESILCEKLFDESFIMIETMSSKMMKCHYLFGIAMWELPQRSKYRWHKISQLRNNDTVDLVVLDLLSHIKGRGHLPL